MGGERAEAAGREEMLSEVAGVSAARNAASAKMGGIRGGVSRDVWVRDGEGRRRCSQAVGFTITVCPKFSVWPAILALSPRLSHCFSH